MDGKSRPLQLLVTGSRSLTDTSLIRDGLQWALDALQARFPSHNPLYDKRSVVLIEGECPHGGADILARDAWWALGRPVLGVPANWKQLGKGAGPARNTVMVDMMPDLTIGFPTVQSRGTYDCLRKSAERGIPTYTWDHDGVTPWKQVFEG